MGQQVAYLIWGSISGNEEAKHKGLQKNEVMCRVEVGGPSPWSQPLCSTYSLEPLNAFGQTEISLIEETFWQHRPAAPSDQTWPALGTTRRATKPNNTLRILNFKGYLLMYFYVTSVSTQWSFSHYYQASCKFHSIRVNGVRLRGCCLQSGVSSDRLTIYG